jgi:hypothetical protein
MRCPDYQQDIVEPKNTFVAPNMSFQDNLANGIGGCATTSGQKDLP